jgi:signal transduction histidine kinase
VSSWMLKVRGTTAANMEEPAAAIAAAGLFPRTLSAPQPPWDSDRSIRMRWQHRPLHPPSPTIDPGSPDLGPTAPRRRQRLVIGALILLAAWLASHIYYRFWVMPYLLIAILVTSLWQVRAGALCLLVALGSLSIEVLSEHPRPWADGFEDMERLIAWGLLAMGARAVLDGIVRQRVTQRRLIGELSRMVEQLRESERQQALAVEALAERNRELQEAQEQLLRSERLAALGQFSATMAHELRNPLNVVKLSAHYVTTHLPQPDEKLHRNLAHLNQYVDRACEIINDLLTFSSLPPPQLRLIPVNEVVREAILALPIPDGVTVEWSLAPDLPPVWADARQIEQAIGNLGQNALQAMTEGGRLAVGTRWEGDRIEIRVEDTGPGVPPEMQEKVFEPFFSTKVTGTGLGLPLVREITLAHGGRFSLESAPGEGACFLLSLPLGEAPAREEAPEAQAPHSPQQFSLQVGAEDLAPGPPSS